jgi:DNA-directed RNA polymerase specialized sigma24 family protein
MNPPEQLHSPLAEMERAFQLATRPPALLALDGAVIGCDLPSGPLPLDELRRLLLHGHLSYAIKDRALGLVAWRAQTGDDLWKVGLAGLLMPGLKRVARRLRRTPGVDPAEVGPEVVVALLEAIAEVDPARERLATRLCWATYRRAARALGVRRRTAWEPVWPMDRPPGSAVPSTNPEEVIARAFKAGVITVDDAELIAQTRLEGQRVIDVAASLAVPASRLQKRRERAESRLTEFLHRELAQATGDVSYGHRSHTGPPSAQRGASVNPAGYRSRPGGRLAGLSVSPSDAMAWAAAAPTDGGVFARMAAA